MVRKDPPYSLDIQYWSLNIRCSLGSYPGYLTFGDGEVYPSAVDTARVISRIPLFWRWRGLPLCSWHGKGHIQDTSLLKMGRFTPLQLTRQGSYPGYLSFEDGEVYSSAVDTARVISRIPLFWRWGVYLSAVDTARVISRIPLFWRWGGLPLCSWYGKGHIQDTSLLEMERFTSLQLTR